MNKSKVDTLEYGREDISMKRMLIISATAFCLLASILCWVGVGFHSSSAAVRDLKTELESIYGTEYTGKETANGTEDMVFVIEPKT